MTYEQTVELSRAEVRAVLLDKLAPADTSKRCHRKTQNVIGNCIHQSMMAVERDIIRHYQTHIF